MIQKVMTGREQQIPMGLNETMIFQSVHAERSTPFSPLNRPVIFKDAFSLNTQHATRDQIALIEKLILKGQF